MQAGVDDGDGHVVEGGAEVVADPDASPPTAATASRTCGHDLSGSLVGACRATNGRLPSRWAPTSPVRVFAQRTHRDLVEPPQLGEHPAEGVGDSLHERHLAGRAVGGGGGSANAGSGTVRSSDRLSPA